MNRRIAYYLAAAAVALGVIAGAGTAMAGRPIDEFDIDERRRGGADASIITVMPEGTQVSLRHAPAASGVVLAGFKTRAGGTEIAV